MKSANTRLLENIAKASIQSDEWVNKRRRLHLNFTPTYASWLNQIEILFNIFKGRFLKVEFGALSEPLSPKL